MVHDEGLALAVLGGALDGETTFAVAIRVGSRVVEARAVRTARIELAALVERALAEAGIRAEAIREVRVDRGPGSYVGLRVAVTFARTLAAFGGTTLRSCTSTLATAAARAGSGDTRERRIVLLLDGRQGRLQFAAYAHRGGRTIEEVPPTLLGDSEALVRIGENDLVLADPGALLRRAADIRATGAACEPLPASSANVLFAPEIDVPSVDPLALEPMYLTGSYVD